MPDSPLKSSTPNFAPTDLDNPADIPCHGFLPCNLIRVAHIRITTGSPKSETLYLVSEVRKVRGGQGPSVTTEDPSIPQTAQSVEGVREEDTDEGLLQRPMDSGQPEREIWMDYGALVVERRIDRSQGGWHATVLQYAPSTRSPSNCATSDPRFLIPSIEYASIPDKLSNYPRGDPLSRSAGRSPPNNVSPTTTPNLDLGHGLPSWKVDP